MDPISAMAFSIIVSWAITKAAWESGVDQAKAEAHHTAEAIRKDLQKRRRAWAKQLENRLADGRKGGPATAIWWGWAAMRTAKGVRRMMRREPRAAEKATGGTTNPFGRVFGAAWRGAQYARDEARRQREAHEKVRSNPVGVCGRCGAVAAKSALVWALTRFGRQEQMCAKCRAAAASEREADQENAAAAGRPEPDVRDADVIHDEPSDASPDTDTPWRPLPPKVPFPHDVPRRPRPTTQPPPGPCPDPEPPMPNVKVTATRADQPARPAGPAPVGTTSPPELGAGSPQARDANPEGERMPRQLMPTGGAVATRNTTMTRRGGGDSYTHGQWNRATADLRRRVDMVPALLEAMLASLNHANAGRTQVAGAMVFREGAVIVTGQIEDMLREVNQRETPMVEAVTTAGGPDEIPDLGYFREI